MRGGAGGGVEGMTYTFKQGRGVIYNRRLNKEYDLDKAKDVMDLCYEMNELERINAELYWKLKKGDD